MLLLAILLVSMVGVVGVAMFVSRTAEHGEARFDSADEKPDKHNAKPKQASRIDENDDQ